MGQTEGSGASRAGGEGIHNEDAFVVEEGLGLYVVCDGASGTPAGEAAARIAAEAVEAFVDAADEALDLRQGRAGRTVVAAAMRHAFTALADAEAREPELGDLATTVTMLLVSGEVGVIGHRGDSRAYLIRRNRAEQLTRDHELSEIDAPEEGDPPSFDVFSIPLQPGDTVVLCTDGAEEAVQEPGIVRAARGLSPPVLASRIVSAAHRARPEQDATAVVMRVRAERDPGWLELSSPHRATTFGHTLERAGSR